MDARGRSRRPGGGGRGIEPPLIDQSWIYGSHPENIFETIQEGRPDGMPFFRERFSAADIWKRVAILVMINRVEVWELPDDRR